jgi:hypothetical protein
MIKRFAWVFAFFLFVLASNGAGAREQDWFAKAFAAVSRNKLTTLKPDCYRMIVDKENAKYLELTVREIHNNKCGGDPMVEPRMFGLRIDKKSGRIWTDVAPPGAKETYDGEFKYRLK